MPHEQPQNALNITRKELEALKLLANGYHNKEIAVFMGISEHTAKFHVNSILMKTKQFTRLGAVVCALKMGIITLQEIMLEVSYTPVPMTLTATAMQILDENKVNLENMKENMTNDINEIIDQPLSVEDVKKHIKDVLDTYFP